MAISEILLVDDETMLLALLSEILREDGYTVHEASSGDHAWELIGQGIRFDVLVTDVRMPGKIDGIELARKLKSSSSPTPVIIMSGYIDNRALEPDLGQFLAKPFAPEAISTMIRKLEPI